MKIEETPLKDNERVTVLWIFYEYNKTNSNLDIETEKMKPIIKKIETIGNIPLSNDEKGIVANFLRTFIELRNELITMKKIEYSRQDTQNLNVCFNVIDGGKK